LIYWLGLLAYWLIGLAYGLAYWFDLWLGLLTWFIDLVY